MVIKLSLIFFFIANLHVFYLYRNHGEERSAAIGFYYSIRAMKAQQVPDRRKYTLKLKIGLGIMRNKGYT